MSSIQPGGAQAHLAPPSSSTTSSTQKVVGGASSFASSSVTSSSQNEMMSFSNVGGMSDSNILVGSRRSTVTASSTTSKGEEKVVSDLAEPNKNSVVMAPLKGDCCYSTSTTGLPPVSPSSSKNKNVPTSSSHGGADGMNESCRSLEDSAIRFLNDSRRPTGTPNIQNAPPTKPLDLSGMSWGSQSTLGGVNSISASNSTSIIGSGTTVLGSPQGNSPVAPGGPPTTILGPPGIRHSQPITTTSNSSSTAGMTAAYDFDLNSDDGHQD